MSVSGGGTSETGGPGGQGSGGALSGGIESRKLSWSQAVFVMVATVIVIVVTIGPMGPIGLIALSILSVVGLRSPLLLRRQLGTVGCGALTWLALWLVAALWALLLFLEAFGGGRSQNSDLYPVIVPIVLGPVVGFLVLSRLWRRV